MSWSISMSGHSEEQNDEIAALASGFVDALGKLGIQVDTAGFYCGTGHTDLKSEKLTDEELQSFMEKLGEEKNA